MVAWKEEEIERKEMWVILLTYDFFQSSSIIYERKITCKEKKNINNFIYKRITHIGIFNTDIDSTHKT